MNVQMFCGELDGQIEPTHIGFRADTIRALVGLMFNESAPDTDGWKLARKAGWRVVKVRVEKVGK